MQNVDLSMERHSIQMARATLRDIPQYDLPAPFRFRLFAPGDAHTWVAVQEAADPLNTIDLARFDREFGSDPAAMPERCFFLSDEHGEAIGTATAWYKDVEGERVGLVHWVAIVPDYQGRGLAKPLLTAVMNRLAERHDRVILNTDTPRLVAIKVYLDFGFVPDLRNDDDRRAWLMVRERLDHPGLRSL